jgi:hypothetical protein
MRRQQRQSKEELGLALAKLFRPGRPRASHPTYENDSVVPGARHEGGDSHQGWLTCNDTGEPIVPVERLPDDPLGAIVLQPNKHGYHTGEIEEAWDAFDRVWGPLDSPWTRDRE